MAAINIVRDNKDPFYRYKMPPIVAKVEGRGNGIRTAVVNASDVARALSRPPSYVIKFFGFELGAQTSINETSDRYIVNGAHDQPKMQDLLDGFISKFVLCASCKNPETDLIITRGGDIIRNCKACGQRTDVDPRHKLTSYIVKNPPASSKSKKKAIASASANTSTSNGLATASPNGEASPKEQEVEDEGYDDDALTKKINAEAAELNLEARDQEEVEWSVDASEEAVRARQKELERGLAAIDLEEEDDGEAYNELGEWIVSETPSDVEIYKKAVELGIAKKHRTLAVLAQTLLGVSCVKDIEEHQGILAKLIVNKNADKQQKNEKALLGGIERLIGLTHPELLPETPRILHKLYELDLLSEEVCVAWGTKVSKKYVDKETAKKVRRAAKSFIDWLQEADSESESDEDSE
ncbi:eukaryotic translation initiation factor 5 [Trichomonascus vanleenenianus]|uniref:translation initiation factor eIF5 n=1 Tax=Trichomonascus vanleenenianus TaxID=2268995 RepID=UPI003EC9CCF4